MNACMTATLMPSPGPWRLGPGPVVRRPAAARGSSMRSRPCSGALPSSGRSRGSGRGSGSGIIPFPSARRGMQVAAMAAGGSHLGGHGMYGDDGVDDPKVVGAFKSLFKAVAVIADFAWGEDYDGEDDAGAGEGYYTVQRRGPPQLPDLSGGGAEGGGYYEEPGHDGYEDANSRFVQDLVSSTSQGSSLPSPLLAGAPARAAPTLPPRARAAVGKPSMSSTSLVKTLQTSIASIESLLVHSQRANGAPGPQEAEAIYDLQLVVRAVKEEYAPLLAQLRAEGGRASRHDMQEVFRVNSLLSHAGVVLRVAEKQWGRLPPPGAARPGAGAGRERESALASRVAALEHAMKQLPPILETKGLEAEVEAALELMPDNNALREAWAEVRGLAAAVSSSREMAEVDAVQERLEALTLEAEGAPDSAAAGALVDELSQAVRAALATDDMRHLKHAMGALVACFPDDGALQEAAHQRWLDAAESADTDLTSIEYQVVMLERLYNQS